MARRYMACSWCRTRMRLVGESEDQRQRYYACPYCRGELTLDVAQDFVVQHSNGRN